MKVFGISGSPRAGGTDYAVNHALEILKEMGCETRYFSARGKDIKFCIHCDYCIKNKQGCVHKDALDRILRGHALGGRRHLRHAMLPGHAVGPDEDHDGPMPGHTGEGPC